MGDISGGDTMQGLIEQIFAEHQARQDSPALILTGGTTSNITYASLWQCVRRIRDTLEKTGLTKGAACCISLPNGPAFVAAFLAVLDLQAVAAPLNPALKQDEIGFSLDDLKAKVVIGPKGFHKSDGDLAKASAGRTLAECYWDGSDVQLNVVEEGKSNTERPMADFGQDGDFAALALHTSGTTGKPKGVPLLHSNLQWSAKNVIEAYSLTEKDRSILIMPLFHIHGIVAGMLALLLRGSCIILPEKGLGPTFWDDFAEHKATWWTATPTHQRVLLSFPPPPEHVVPRFIRSCSSPLAPSLLSELEKTFKAPVLEAYAMTENAHHIASHTLDQQRRPGTVGSPVSTISLKVIDANEQEVAQGQAGEIVIKGPSVTPGYLHNPEANAKGFTKDGYFRTGDQGEIDDLGHVKLTGRLKELINKGGEKINPNEVDQAVSKHEDVAEAVAFAMPDELYGEEVAVALVFREGKSLNATALKQWLRGQISEFKIPQHIFPMESIPKTATGKVQRTGLASKVRPAETQAPADVGGLKALWSQVLNVDESSIGEDASFFDLGGNSAQAIRLVNKASSSKMRLEAATVFRYPVLGEMAKHCSARQEKAPAKQAPKEKDDRNLKEKCASESCVSPESVDDIAPLTGQQKRLASLCRDHGLWVMTQAFACKNTSLKQLEGVIETITSRHPILRSRTVVVDGEYYNVMTQERPVWYTASSISTYLAQVHGLRVQYGTPQIRFAYIDDEKEGPHFVFTATHTIQDVWTRNLLYDELRLGLSDLSKLQSLPPPTSFCDFARYATSIDREAAKDFYSKLMAGYDKWSYLDHTPDSEQPSGMGNLARTFTPINTSATDLGDVTRVNLAWALTLASLSPTTNKHIFFPTVSSGRLAPVPGADTMMGPTLATVPICVDPSTTLNRVREILFDGVPYEVTAAENMTRHFGTPERETLLNCSEMPEGDGMVVRAAVDGGAELRLRREKDQAAYGTMSMVVHTRVWKVESGLQVSAEFDRARASGNMVQDLVDRFVGYLGRVHEAGVETPMKDLM